MLLIRVYKADFISTLTLEGVSLKNKRGGEVNRTLPSTFDTIHPIDLIFSTYNELSVYFQLIKTTYCLIGFHGNHNHINFEFSKFQIFIILESSTENGEKYKLLAIGIYKIVRNIVKFIIKVFRQK